MFNMADFLYWGIFGALNSYIIFQDISKKKIPNIWILLLLILGIFGAIFFENVSLEYFSSFLLILLWSFLCFYFWLWGAGDAKYILVLSLFLPGKESIILLGNIAGITLFFLSLHVFHMYFVKCIYLPEYRKSLWENMSLDISQKWKIYSQKKSLSFEWITLLREWGKIIFLFLLVFTSFRLLRMYIIDLYGQANTQETQGQNFPFIIELMIDHGVIVIGIIFVALIFFLRTLRKYFMYYSQKITEKVWFSQKKIYRVFFWIFTFLFFIFLFYEYKKDPFELQEHLIHIFTFSLFLWMFIKILLYLYYITFQLQEIIYKPIDDLSTWDIVDIPFLIQIFGTQFILWYQNENGKYSPDPKIFFEKIENPLNQESVQNLQDIYSTVNEYHLTHQTPGFDILHGIKTLKTFSFGPYIGLWACITLIFWDYFLQLWIQGILILFGN